MIDNQLGRRNLTKDQRRILIGKRYNEDVKPGRPKKKDAELQNIIAEQKLRTQRILGELLKDNEVSKNKLDNLNNVSKSSSSTSTLSDYGLSKYESSTFQKIAKENNVSDRSVKRYAKDAEFARRNKVTKQKQDELGEFRIEIEAKKGAWLDEFFPQGGTGANQYTKEQSSSSRTLADIGVDKHESANARIISKNSLQVLKTDFIFNF